MQRVQRCKTKSSAVLSGKLDAALEGQLRQRNLQPKSGGSIALEILGDHLRLISRKLTLEKTHCNGMRPFRAMQRCEPNALVMPHQTPSIGRMHVRKV